jgi:Carbohydrate binding domain/Cellulase (glycosyl hydrolase family 5)
MCKSATHTARHVLTQSDSFRHFNRETSVTLKQLIIAIGAGVVCSLAQAQVNSSTPGWFPFNVSALDVAPSPIDLSYLNVKPAGKNGFLRAQNGVIVDGTGKRVKLFGVNIGGVSAFPDKTVAPKIAQHLAKAGVNLVRFHAMEFNWGATSLLNNPDNGTLNTANLDRLDFFMAELKKQGIYVNMNVHVLRKYPGTPDGFDFSKGLDLIYPPFFAQFKQYARDLLAHKNPYTGLAYTQDPAVAFIELNNENTVGMFEPIQFTTLPEPLNSDIKRQWTEWVRAKYGTTAALRAAWGVNDGSIGSNIVPNPNFANNAAGWNLETNVGSAATLAPIPGGVPGVRWTTTRKGTEDWALQLNYAGLNLTEGQAYRFSFKAKSNAARNMDVAVMLDQDPFSSGGVFEAIALTTAFKNYSFDFIARGTRANHIRTNFSANNQLGVFDIAEVNLQTISGGALTPTQTFESNNIPFTAKGLNIRALRDFSAFLIDTERSHAKAARAFVKTDLAAKPMVYQTQIGYGGMAGVIRDKGVADAVDNHAYWQHPRFPGEPFDSKNWSIGNTSQLADAAGGELAGLAISRIVGKPFTISEYNVPAPSDYAAETLPGLAAIAGFQDWDALYFFAYAGEFGPGPTPTFGFDYDKIPGWFTGIGHPSIMSFMPAAALMFRTGAIQPGRQLVTLTASDEQVRNDQGDRGVMWGSFDRFWQQVGLSKQVALKHRTAIDVVPGNAATTVSFMPTLTNPIVSDTNELTWDSTKATMTLNAPKARIAMGKLSGQTYTLGDARINVGTISGNGHGHVALVALDDKAIAQSDKLLLTALGRSENQNMGWNATRTTVTDQWGTGPAVVQGIAAAITLPGGPWNVDSLDPAGVVKTRIASAANSFSLTAAQKSVWYLVSKAAPVGTGGEIILDNLAVGGRDATRSFTGTWCSSIAANKYGATSLYSCGAARDSYRWTPNLAKAGKYQVYVWWPSNPNRSASVPLTVVSPAGSATKMFDQKTAGGSWVLHGTYSFNAGNTGYVEVSDVNGQAGADAVKFVLTP